MDHQYQSAAYTPRIRRKNTTPEQNALMEEVYITVVNPTLAHREHLVRVLGISESSIRVWFQNRRAKSKLMERRASAATLEFPKHSSQLPYLSTKNLHKQRLSIDSGTNDSGVSLRGGFFTETKNSVDGPDFGNRFNDRRSSTGAQRNMSRERFAFEVNGPRRVSISVADICNA